MSGGWICLHRAMVDWEWYDDINVCRLFIHCLLKANHAPNKWRGIVINRGQFWTSLESLSRETGLSVKQIRTCFTKLESTGEVASKGQAKGRMVTISNYDSYQEEGRQRAGKGQAKGRQRATNNNDNNDNNDNYGGDVPSPAPKAKSNKIQFKTYLKNCDDSGVDPIPEDSIVFKNADQLSLPHEFVIIAWEHFKDYWLGKPSPKSDWVQTFNNCLKNDGYSAYRKNANGEWFLTTKGKSTEILMNSGVTQ